MPEPTISNAGITASDTDPASNISEGKSETRAASTERKIEDHEASTNLEKHMSNSENPIREYSSVDPPQNNTADVNTTSQEQMDEQSSLHTQIVSQSDTSERKVEEVERTGTGTSSAEQDAHRIPTHLGTGEPSKENQQEAGQITANNDSQAPSADPATNQTLTTNIAIEGRHSPNDAGTAGNVQQEQAVQSPNVSAGNTPLHSHSQVQLSNSDSKQDMHSSSDDPAALHTRVGTVREQDEQAESAHNTLPEPSHDLLKDGQKKGGDASLVVTGNEISSQESGTKDRGENVETRDVEEASHPLSTTEVQDRKAPEEQSSESSSLVAPAKGSSSVTQVNGAAKKRQEEVSRIQRENEDLRLMWLSLPLNDHPSHYSDDDDLSSSEDNSTDVLLPRNAAGRLSHLPLQADKSIPYKRRHNEWLDEEEHEETNSSDEDEARIWRMEETTYRTGNRGNKLNKTSQWTRRHKLGTFSEARTEKEIHERFTHRVKALQRQNVESMLRSARGGPVSHVDRDILEGSSRLLQRDSHEAPFVEESSTLLAPQLLRPILSPRALLQSHTLRHTFRNPHVVALSRTALDLRESEGNLSRALARCLGAMERTELNIDANEQTHQEGHKSEAIDPHAVGVEGTQGTEDELNPSFAQLDRLFVTKEGLPIPFGGSNEEKASEHSQPLEEPQAVLTAAQQRDVIRAALECLHELGADSLEYCERLDEVRSRLSAVKQKRSQVWNALRMWALKRDGYDFEGTRKSDGFQEDDHTTRQKPPASSGKSGKRNRDR